jgi:hypothetical protein
VPKWLLPTISEILVLSDPTWTVQPLIDPAATRRSASRRTALHRLRAEREWSGAIAALSKMLQRKLQAVGPSAELEPQGFVLSGPLPVLSQPELTANLATWTLTASALELNTWMPLQLLPAVREKATPIVPDTTPAVLPLLPGDPLATEQFCFVLTPWFSLVMVLGETLTGEPAFMFSFMPDVIERVWAAIRPRILLLCSHRIDQLDAQVDAFPPVVPDYQTVMQFSRLMLEHLPDWVDEPETEKIGKSDRTQVKNPQPPIAETFNHCPLPDTQAPDVELLQALAHEVRTPLTTIRTLTRSLMRRKDLSADVLKRLAMIDRECNEQIDRFNLIFRAVELETATTQANTLALTRTSLAQVLQQSIPRWQQQASQRNLTLDVVLPKHMPAVVSDPSILDQALTSLIERFTRSLPAGSHIRVEVMLAGDQLKLQLQSQLEAPSSAAGVNSAFAMPVVSKTPLKSIGQLLSFQPETGSLSLNLTVTKNLFQSLGGKLIVRQRPQQGEVMTVFLPLEMSSFPLEVGGSEVLEV